MPKMDSRHWRRAGFIPAAAAARAVCMSTGSLHRHMDKGRIKYESQGRYRFVKFKDMVEWVRLHFTGEMMQNTCIARLREARKLRNDYGQGGTKS